MSSLPVLTPFPTNDLNPSLRGAGLDCLGAVPAGVRALVVQDLLCHRLCNILRHRSLLVGDHNVALRRHQMHVALVELRSPAAALAQERRITTLKCVIAFLDRSQVTNHASLSERLYDIGDL